MLDSRDSLLKLPNPVETVTSTQMGLILLTILVVMTAVIMNIWMAEGVQQSLGKLLNLVEFFIPYFQNGNVTKLPQR